MGKLEPLVTNQLTDEAISYQNGQNNVYNVQFKQTYEVTINSDYTWTVKSSLYLRLNPNYPSGSGEIFHKGVWLGISGNYYRREQNIQLLSLSGHWIDGVQVSNNAYEYYKILEVTQVITNNTGRKRVIFNCGTIGDPSPGGDTEYLCTDYRYIYATMPSFSGMFIKINGNYKRAMPWVKVDGVWKRALQYKKIGNEWEKYNDTYIFPADN